VGAYGYPKPTTPRVDALAREGILCEDAVSTSSWTLPAHLSLMTSVDPALHGGVDMRHGFNRSVPTLAAVLRGAGFATEAVTNHLYVSATYGFAEGFEQMDYRFDRSATATARTANAALDRIGDRPFFLFVHFFDPHWRYSPPAEVQRLFEEQKRAARAASIRDFRGRDRSNTSPAELAAILARYDGEIRHTDNAIGRMLDHMKARGLHRGTLVVVTSDHGEEFLDHGSWEHQKTLYEELIRIPLLFQGPGLAPRREAAQVSLLDVMPTILAWAGIPAPERAMGRSLLETPVAREAYGETDHAQDGTRKLFLRDGRTRWKVIVSLSHDAAAAPREEWYDLGSDPAETRSARPPDAVAEDMRRRALERWRLRQSQLAGSPPAVRLTPEEQERLRALGYVGP
jgi:arylsulfatase A-like enzyme